MADPTQDFWQPWIGPTGTSGTFLGVTGAVTGPAFFGVTGVAAPTGPTGINDNMSYLYNRCRVEVVGASDAMVRMMLFDILHEFFEGTSLWVEAIPGNLQPGISMYFLQPGNPQSLGDNVPTGRIIRLVQTVDLNHFPISADMPQPPVLNLQFAPSNVQPVFVTVVKSIDLPPETTTLPCVPVWTVPQYEPYLLAGVKGKLMLQPDRPYSDLKMGTSQYQYFRQGVSIGRVAALRRNQFGGQGWYYPQGYQTRSQRGWVVTTGAGRWF